MTYTIADLTAERDRLRAWRRDGSGYCRHGMYTGGSGADYMCGPCEDYSMGEELAYLTEQIEALRREEVQG